MKQFVFFLLYCSYLQQVASFPIEETPGFTPWSQAKRAPRAIPELEFSGVNGVPLGIFETANFGIPDPTCRERLPREGCWTMDEFTVDKMIGAQLEKPETKNCNLKCLFYTQRLSGAAEREANFVFWDYLLTGATEGPRKYLTIWDLHDRKYYPDERNLDATPELKCAYLDIEPDDLRDGISGCQRRYFMSMSKAMAAQCEGEVFLMTMTDLVNNDDVPEDGIWWQVEFPTLIDEKRAGGKVTKITYLQVDDLTIKEFEALKDLPKDQRRAPEVRHQKEYWPKGPGKNQLDKIKARRSEGRSAQQEHSSNISTGQIDPQHERTTAPIGFVKRAERSDEEVCDFGEDCYPYPYPIEDMYAWYKDATW
ncbi:hypothetical protein FB567DRAFT_594924 [Paraphoma chrysanthemicola]|uniref:Uncharacterized protein n=1 Tax=Paraphoma chrysanthemicola TaxID=798071 RepID=A0A8K0VWW1_9PLEO|nr:hypothetical protein FB567DRAFT_594924 [Paraphoma chrysanthemicola]